MHTRSGSVAREGLPKVARHIRQAAASQKGRHAQHLLLIHVSRCHQCWFTRSSRFDAPIIQAQHALSSTVAFAGLALLSVVETVHAGPVTLTDVHRQRQFAHLSASVVLPGALRLEVCRSELQRLRRRLVVLQISEVDPSHLLEWSRYESAFPLLAQGHPPHTAGCLQTFLDSAAFHMPSKQDAPGRAREDTNVTPDTCSMKAASASWRSWNSAVAAS